MTIDISLDSVSLDAAIRKLEAIKGNLMYGIGEFVDIMCIDGAAVANSAYEGEALAVASRDSEDENKVTGHIGVTSDNDDAAIIAEFGAGDATMESQFENPPPVIVEPGSFSRSEKGTGEYAKYGSWHYKGDKYTEVQPKHGLLNAREYIKENAANTAREVIRLD